MVATNKQLEEEESLDRFETTPVYPNLEFTAHTRQAYLYMLCWPQYILTLRTSVMSLATMQMDSQNLALFIKPKERTVYKANC